MKILFLDQFSDLGGAQLCLRDVLAEVRRRRWVAEVMAPGDGPLLGFARDCGFATAGLPLPLYANGRKSASDALRFGIDMASCARAVDRVLRERPADLVYVNGPRVLPATLVTRVPVLFHSHSLLEKRYAQVIAKWCLRHQEAGVLTCSEFAAGPLKTMLGDERVRVIYNGVGDQGFRARNAERGPLRVGILGRIAPEKGHLDFIRAARLLADRADIQFAVIGAAMFSSPEYERSVRSLAAESPVEFHGWTDDVAGALGDLDVLAVPSASKEASTRVVMEAMSAGVCVVAYPSGGIPELIDNGRTGVLSDQCSHEELAAAIRRLADDPDLRSSLAVSGRREWEGRFRVERFQHEVCEAIEEAITLPAPAASGARSA